MATPNGLMLKYLLHFFHYFIPPFDSYLPCFQGNLSSIDRSYGFIVDNLIHDIGTHQIHHLFPKIPHYKLKTATVAFRKQYPHLVRQSDENIVLSFAKNWLNYTKYGNAPVGVEKFTYKDTIAQLNVNSQKAK